jgi:hypothetical protein
LVGEIERGNLIKEREIYLTLEHKKMEIKTSVSISIFLTPSVNPVPSTVYRLTPSLPAFVPRIHHTTEFADYPSPLDTHQ